jgi:hypothetical protein
MDYRNSRRGRNTGIVQLDFSDDRPERSNEMNSLERAREEIAKYEHPFFEFEAREAAGGVELVIRAKMAGVLNPEYKITFDDRDLQSSQFPWTFQKLLYDCLTDYIVELFTKSPMTG